VKWEKGVYVMAMAMAITLPSTPYFFSDVFPMEFCGIPESEAEIPIPDPPARGAVPAEFPTKMDSINDSPPPPPPQLSSDWAILSIALEMDPHS
jgi:hypothetical protein